MCIYFCKIGVIRRVARSESVELSLYESMTVEKIIEVLVFPLNLVLVCESFNDKKYQVFASKKAKKKYTHIVRVAFVTSLEKSK